MGTIITLFDDSSNSEGLTSVYDIEASPYIGNMDDFCGEVLTGNDTWELKVYDTILGDTGQVDEWVLWITFN